MTLSSLPFIRTYREIFPRVTIYLIHFFFIIMALFLQAYMHNFNIVYITLFIVLGVAMSSCYFGRINLKGISLTPINEGRIFANHESDLHWNIHNDANNPAYDLEFTCNDSKTHLTSVERDGILLLGVCFWRKVGDERV